MAMRVWPLFLFAACAAGSVAACITQEDPPYGGPGAIGAAKFGGATGSSNTSGGGGDGGSSGGNNGLFPGPFDEANPVAPAALAPTHPGALDGGIELQGAATVCLACHGPAGAATSKWAFAGWAASGPGVTTPLDKGEVVVTGGGAPIVVKTSPDGYFWGAGTLPTNARTAIRDKTGKMSEMAGTATGDCNTAGACHGTALPIDFKP